MARRPQPVQSFSVCSMRVRVARVPVACFGRELTRNRRAMTLIEVLVASVILGVGIAGLMLAATAGVRNQQRSDLRLAAAYFAKEKLAEIETIGPHVYSLSNPTSGAESRADLGFAWAVEIDSLTAGELFRVQVDVECQGAGCEGRASLETLLNDYEAAVAEMFQEERRKGAIDANMPLPGS